jgi:hypothetical protein
MSLEDRAALASAPKRNGTTVTVESYPVGPPWDPAEHMYAEFDDGRDSYIYRGGPDPDLRLGASVVPAHLSRDFGRGRRVLYQSFLPDVSATQAIQPAQADAAQINRSEHPYLGVTSNSNSVIGDFTARQYGQRVGNGPLHAFRGWTPGYAYDLPDPGVDQIPTGMYRPTNSIW